MAEMMQDRLLWLLIGLVLGYLIARTQCHWKFNRALNKRVTQIEQTISKESST